MIESRMCDVAEKYKPTVEVVVEYPSPKSSPYVVLKAGPIILTESMVEERCQLPRQAKHRQANARLNYGLFSDLEETLPDDHPIYAILTHVPHWQKPEPLSVDLIFPNARYDGIEGPRIDLLAAFSGRAFVAPAAEEKISEPAPELKKDRKNRKAE